MKKQLVVLAILAGFGGKSSLAKASEVDAITTGLLVGAGVSALVVHCAALLMDKHPEQGPISRIKSVVIRGSLAAVRSESLTILQKWSNELSELAKKQNEKGDGLQLVTYENPPQVKRFLGEPEFISLLSPSTQTWFQRAERMRGDFSKSNDLFHFQTHDDPWFVLQSLNEQNKSFALSPFLWPLSLQPQLLGDSHFNERLALALLPSPRGPILALRLDNERDGETVLNFVSAEALERFLQGLAALDSGLTFQIHRARDSQTRFSPVLTNVASNTLWVQPVRDGKPVSLTEGTDMLVKVAKWIVQQSALAVPGFENALVSDHSGKKITEQKPEMRHPFGPRPSY